MTIQKKRHTGRIEVDLTGPEGNAFCLLGATRQWAKQLGKDWPKIEQEAMGGDYEHLVLVLDREFGEYVTFLK